MKITYIGHSGFLIEWEACYWLFDYFKGDIPEMDPKKKIFVFVSHKHGDHYNPMIFKLFDIYQDVEYILSSDINLVQKNSKEMDINKISDKLITVKPSKQYEIYDNNKNVITLRTLKSTDCGVAFLLQYQERTIYHAGDLNLWVWKEESKQHNNNMTALYNKEIDNLTDIPIDVAFVPLDPRQEEWYYLGMERLLNATKVKYVFPMHFWDQPSIVQKYKRERGSNVKDTQIIDILQDGQIWKIEL